LARSRPHRDRDRRPAATLTSDRLRGVRLERIIELDNVRLSVRDWPGFSTPFVCVPDPYRAAPLVDHLASVFAPHRRVLSIEPRLGVAYQVAAADLLDALAQFGFTAPVLLGEGLGCLPALLVATWHPDRVGRLILLDPTCTPPADDTPEARALRDCPPDWSALRSRLSCPVFETTATAPDLVERIEAFLL